MKSINQRIRTSVNDDVLVVKKWLTVREKKNFTYSQTLDYVFNEFMKSNWIEKKKDINEKEIEQNDHLLEQDRIDNNFIPSLKKDLEAVQEMIVEKKIMKNKPTINDLVRILLTNYIEKYPELKSAVLEDKYIHQKVAFKKIRDQRLGIG